MSGLPPDELLHRLDVALTVAGGILLACVAFSNAVAELASVVLCATFLARVAVTRSPGVPHPFAWLVGIWLFVGVVSLLFSSDLHQSVRTFSRKTIEYALLALAAAAIGRDDRSSQKILTVLVWAGFWIGIDTLIQWVWGRDLLRFRSMVSGHLTGPFVSTNNFASYLVMVIPVQLLALSRQPLRWRQCLLSAAVVLELLELAQTDSRSAWYGFAASLLVLLVLTRRWWIMGGVLLVVVGMFWREGSGSFATMVKLDPGRAEGWRVAWQMFLDHPFVGIGLGTYMANYMAYVPILVGDWSRPQYAHNCYLQLLAEGGVIGVAVFLLLVGWVLCTSLRQLRSSPKPSAHVLMGLVAALVAFLVNMAFDTGLYSLPMATMFWFLLGLAAGQVSREPGSRPVA